MPKVLTADDFDEAFLLEFAVNEPDEFKFWFDEKSGRNAYRFPRKFVTFKPDLPPYQRLLHYKGNYYIAIDEYDAFYDLIHIGDFSTVYKKYFLSKTLKEILNGTPFHKTNPAASGSSFLGSYNVF